MKFPSNFLWGTATASYQIEGASAEDGKGQSIWDVFCGTPGAVYGGHRGDSACDHYHRSIEDVKLLSDIGVNAYRFSISWPRILPGGKGAVNEKGLDFYDRLIDELVKRSIEPCVTLFHWDLPYALHLEGGWLSPGISDYFAAYVERVAKRFSDRVKIWFTLNEPQCFIGLGYKSGRQAPGFKLALPEVLLCYHNALLAHGKAVLQLRANAKSKARIGHAPAYLLYIPASESEADIDAARRANFAITSEKVRNTMWLDPVYKGRYPADAYTMFGYAIPRATDQEMSTICQPLDFFGINIYSATRVEADDQGNPRQLPAISYDLTAANWEITPEALYWIPRLMYERYNMPIMITENGMSNSDIVSADGHVHDPQRIEFTRRYLLELRRAIDYGIPVEGYFHWTLLDNFEWSEGYKEKFGLIYVDFRTQKRIVKDSATWYREVIKSNGESLKGDSVCLPQKNSRLR